MEIQFNVLSNRFDIVGMTAAEVDAYVKLDQTTPQTTTGFILSMRGVLASAPSSPQQGWMYINSGDNVLYIYYGSTWQALHTLSLLLNYLLLETGDSILLEDGVSKLALEV